MDRMRHLETIYLYFLKNLENPRIHINDFYKMQTTYASFNALSLLIREAFEKEIISQPEIFCNHGLSVDLKNTTENPLELLEECKKDPLTTYAIALCGAWSFIRVRKGASDIKFSDRVTPTYPAKTTPQELWFETEGVLKEDHYPHGWDEIDWEVYFLMKNPSLSFTEAIRRSRNSGSGISRPTLRKRFPKVLEACKVQMNFFPEGYEHYDKVFFTFKTKYEIDLFNALKDLDRTSILWKVKDYVILILFVEQYCATVKHFKEIEENGLIHDLTVSIPTWHSTPLDKN